MKPIALPALVSFGAFGMPVALAALPVYVILPQLYAQRFGVSLAVIGVTLLIIRIGDAVADPLIGAWIDRRAALSPYGRSTPVLASLPLLAIGYLALLHPPAWVASYALVWFGAWLVIAYAGLSIAAIAHQSWGAALTQAPGERVRLSAARELCGLVGVVLAAVLADAMYAASLSALLILALGAGAWLLLLRAPRPAMAVEWTSGFSVFAPFRGRRFRWLFSVFVLNGIAASIPATLFMFFVSDRMALGTYAGIFLALYFLAAAASMPAWTAAARRFGEARTWRIAMFLAVAAFVWSYVLSAGDALAFAAVCCAAGAAFGADLALPPALLAAVIADAGHSGRREGTYFGAWNWANKMNLAVAAGVGLPLLGWLDYQPGRSDPAALQSLATIYALLPCALKLCAAGVLRRAPLYDL